MPGADYDPSPEDLMHGFLGSEIFVNGTHCPYLDVATRVYRFRILNAANARTLLLAFRTASGAPVPFMLIGNDGGLLAGTGSVPTGVARERRTHRRARGLARSRRGRQPAPPNAWRSIRCTRRADRRRRSIMRATGHPMPATPLPAAGNRHAGSWPEGAPRALIDLRVRSRVGYDRPIPSKLSTLAAVDTANASERALRLGFAKGRWRINDRVFEMGATPIEVARGAVETWLIRNYHTSMPHAMHLHGFHFEVLARETSPDAIAATAVDPEGRLATDMGRKDTILVWPGESVRVAIDFAHPFPGPQTYLFHCHNLEHEDGGMMLGVAVG